MRRQSSHVIESRVVLLDNACLRVRSDRRERTDFHQLDAIRTDETLRDCCGPLPGYSVRHLADVYPRANPTARVNLAAYAQNFEIREIGTVWGDPDRDQHAGGHSGAIAARSQCHAVISREAFVSRGAWPGG